MTENTRPPPATTSASPAATGIEGLDDILAGGLTANRLFAVGGEPGSGKTTLGLQFLLEGVRRHERTLYITLSETEDETRAVAASHGWTMEGIAIRELVPTEDSLLSEGRDTMFHPLEVELGETMTTILADVEQIKPARVVFDSLSALRLLTGSPFRYRRQILALKRFFADRKCTVLLLDDSAGSDRDLQIQSLADGIIHLEQLVPEYGPERRRLVVLKYRGVRYKGGYHDFTIRRGGLRIYPRMSADGSRLDRIDGQLAADNSGLDAMLGGGLERGTSTLILGAAGTGKSSLAAQFVAAAAARGQHAALFIFDESVNTLRTRCAGLGVDLGHHLEAGRVTVRAINPAELSPGEFAQAIRDAVERHHASLVVIDSLNGYLHAMPGERFLVIQLHEILTYMGQAGVATLLTGSQRELIGGDMTAPVDASYLADSIILMRHVETNGEVRQAISVVSKRSGAHERAIREFRLEMGRITVGPPRRDARRAHRRAASR